MPTQIGENRAKKMLKANELVLCMGVNQLRTPNIAMIAAACGFDAVYIDLEHNPTSLETAAGVCVAALGIRITPIARVTSHDPHDATRILDCGAQGVMVPHIQNAADARAIVEACLYAPKGHSKEMGVGGVRQDFEFQSWLMRLGVRYLTGGSDVGYILSAGRADVKQLRELKL